LRGEKTGFMAGVRGMPFKGKPNKFLFHNDCSKHGGGKTERGEKIFEKAAKEGGGFKKIESKPT